jgi:hypothetical protein
MIRLARCANAVASANMVRVTPVGWAPSCSGGSMLTLGS